MLMNHRTVLTHKKNQQAKKAEICQQRLFHKTKTHFTSYRIPFFFRRVLLNPRAYYRDIIEEIDMWHYGYYENVIEMIEAKLTKIFGGSKERKDKVNDIIETCSDVAKLKSDIKEIMKKYKCTLKDEECTDNKIEHWCEDILLQRRKIRDDEGRRLLTIVVLCCFICIENDVVFFSSSEMQLTIEPRG